MARTVLTKADDIVPSRVAYTAEGDLALDDAVDGLLGVRATGGLALGDAATHPGVSVQDGLGLSDAPTYPGGGASLTRGAGSNIPSGGTGWSLHVELDVTQSDQTALKSSLGYLANLGFVGARWTTPDGDGSGAYWDLEVDGRRCMEFRWGAGALAEQRVAIHDFTSPSRYDELYQRLIFRLNTQEYWADGSTKLIRSMYNAAGGGNAFFNIFGQNVVNPPDVPMGWAWTNIFTGNGDIEYRTPQNHDPSAFDTWYELEMYSTTNSAGNFDGTGRAWIGPVGSPAAITNFSEIPSGTIGPVTVPSNIQYFSGTVGHDTDQIGPYIGGADGYTLTQDQSIYFATYSAWVK